MLYQFCHTGGSDTSSVTVTRDESWRNYWTAANVVLIAGMVVTAGVCFVLPLARKKKTTKAN